MKFPRSIPTFAPVPRSSDDFAQTLDKALASEQDGILPSSGFAGSVMTAIAHDAVAPAPIPFPWKRALPGIAVAALVFALLIAVVVSMLLSAPAPAVSAHSGGFNTAGLLPLLRSTQGNILLWTAGALGLSAVSFAFFRRLLTSH